MKSKVIGYKVVTKDLKAPIGNDFSYVGCNTKGFIKEYKGELKLCSSGIHVYKSLSNVSIGDFGSRIFKVEILGKYLEDSNKYCCNKIKFIEEIDITEVTDSCWAYYYCKYIKDRKEIYSKITDSMYAYYYCRKVKDRKEIYSKITDSYCAYCYCKDVKDRKEVAKYITDKENKDLYNRYVK